MPTMMFAMRSVESLRVKDMKAIINGIRNMNANTSSSSGVVLSPINTPAFICSITPGWKVYNINCIMPPHSQTIHNTAIFILQSSRVSPPHNEKGRRIMFVAFSFYELWKNQLSDVSIESYQRLILLFIWYSDLHSSSAFLQFSKIIWDDPRWSPLAPISVCSVVSEDRKKCSHLCALHSILDTWRRIDSTNNHLWQKTLGIFPVRTGSWRIMTTKGKIPQIQGLMIDHDVILGNLSLKCLI